MKENSAIIFYEPPGSHNYVEITFMGDAKEIIEQKRKELLKKIQLKCIELVNKT